MQKIKKNTQSFRLISPEGSPLRTPVKQKERERERERFLGSAADSDEEKPHILVVDDEPVNCKMVDVALRRAGMKVIVCNDGVDAVKLMQQSIAGAKKVDLILMDMRMKVMNGEEAASNIRDLETAASRPPVPILALSGGGLGSVGSSDNEYIFKAGMQGLLLKPLSMRSFPATVAQCLFHFSTDLTQVDMAGRKAAPGKYRVSVIGDATIVEV